MHITKKYIETQLWDISQFISGFIIAVTIQYFFSSGAQTISVMVCDLILFEISDSWIMICLVLFLYFSRNKSYLNIDLLRTLCITVCCFFIIKKT